MPKRRWQDEDFDINANDDMMDMHDDHESSEDDLNLDDDDDLNLDDDDDLNSEEDVDDEFDTEDSVDDEETDAGRGGMTGVEDSIGDLEDALAELKAEFERLESGEDDEVEDEVSDDEVEDDDTEEMDESWLDEDWDDLAEAVELEKVKVPASGEVGSGKFSSDTGEKAKSPIAASQTQRMGAKPITVDSKRHNGFNKETAPTSKELGITNRRKTAEAGMSKVSKEGNAAAALNKTESEFSVNKNSMSPLSKSPRK